MPVSASAVVCRELVAAHAATSTALARAAAAFASEGFAGIKKPRARRGFLIPQKDGKLSAAERTATLAGALWALLCFVDAQRPAVHLKAVQGLDRGLRLGLGHVDESETTRFAGFPVVDELHGFHFAVTFKQGLHVLLGGVEGQIAHVNRRHQEVSLAKADSGEPHGSVAYTA